MELRKNETVQCRVTTLQYERIKNLTQAKGFLRIADYLRFAALERDLAFEMKFEELREALLKICEQIEKLKPKS